MDMIDILSNEYMEDNWIAYSRSFEESDIHIKGIPQDIINAVVAILGNEVGCHWLCSPFHNLGGENAIELLKTPKGERALKAYIMRLPN